MNHHHATPVWEHAGQGLAIRIGRRADLVPEPLSVRLLDPASTGTCADPAEALLALEAGLRQAIANLVDHVHTAGDGVSDARAALADARPLRLRFVRPRQRALRTALQRHAEATELLLEARVLRDALRKFVVELDPPSGPLAEAAAGWQREDNPPTSVIVFDDEDAFLAADTRRAGHGSGYPSLVGTAYGRQWRRDGDDDPLAIPPGHGGAWTVGHIPRTGEIYACRRSSEFDRQLWLLGQDFTADQADALLTEIEPRMREPNSVVLAATTVHAARFLRSTVLRDAAPLHRSAAAGEDVTEDRTDMEAAG